MFGFLKKQLQKGVEKLTKKIEEAPPEKEKVAKAEDQKTSRTEKQKPAKHRPEAWSPKPRPRRMPPSERPIEVLDDEPKKLIIGHAEETEKRLEDDASVVEENIEEQIATEKHVESELEKREEIEADVAEEEIEEKKGLFSRFKGAVTEKTFSSEDIDDFFTESEPELLQNNVALEVTDFLRKELKQKLVEKPIKRSQASQFITRAFEDSIFDAVNQGEIDIEERIKEAKKEGRPLLITLLGFNGSGKTTSAAKLARYLTNHKHGVVLAAGDTFRAASIEQLELHAEKLGVDIVKHRYGADAAAVIFDAVQHAKSKGLDVVLADTAGRTHTDKNLMEELKKLIRVNKPDLKILVVDSLTGNDAVEQARQFNEAVGVDAVFMTKVDVNEKGGSILSVCYAIKKPLLFIGVGQGYDDIKAFKPADFVKNLLE